MQTGRENLKHLAPLALETLKSCCQLEVEQGCRCCRKPKTKNILAPRTKRFVMLKVARSATAPRTMNTDTIREALPANTESQDSVMNAAGPLARVRARESHPASAKATLLRL